MKKPVSQGAKFSRFAFEQFLIFFGLLSPIDAAFRIGMDRASFGRVVQYAKEQLGVPDQAIGLEDMAFREDFVDRLHHFFPTLRNRTFSDHSLYCKALHEAFRGEGLEIEARYDPVSMILDKSDPDLVHGMDIITCEPMGLRYSVWLNFGKPFSLEPDKTSLKTFIEHRALLEGYVPDYFSIDKNALAKLGELKVA